MTTTIDSGQAPVGVGAGVNPNPPPTETPQTPALAPSISQAIANAVSAAPELKQDPGTAVAVGAAGGTAVKAQAVAQAGKRQANATAQDQVTPTGTNIFGDIAHDVGSALGKVAHYANDGLATVQHEYRYLHDVEARHGMTAAVMLGAGMLAGAAAGTVVDPGEGTVLGAEGAAYLEAQVEYKDSWQRTLNPNYRDPHTGQLVSFGRDVASVAGLRGGERTAVSGALDGLGDLIADPLGLAGKGLGEAHSVEGMGGLLGQRYQGLAITAENVDQAWDTLPSFRRQMSLIAAAPDVASVRRLVPQFNGIANELAAADTAEEAKDVFKELAASSEMLDAAKLPTMAASRLVFKPLRDMVRNLPNDAEGPVAGFLARHTFNNTLLGPRRWADRLEALPGSTFDPETMDISGSQINPANTRGLNDLYALMRYGGTDRDANAVVNAYAAATPAQRIVIVKNGIFRTLFAMAGMPSPEDSEKALSELVDGRTKAAIQERLDNHLSSAAIEGNQPERIYGTMPDGKIVRPVIDEEGVSVQGAIRANQTGNISLPNIVEARRMAQAIRSSRTSRVLAGTDDFLYDHVTQGFFKPLVLMSGGYGLHISLAEAIPNALRHGLTASVGGLYDRAIANLGYKADKEELGLLSGWLYSVAGRRALQNSTDAQYLTEVYLANEGYKTTTGVAAGEITQGETQPVERALGGFRQKMASGTKEGSQFSTFGNEDPRIVKLWQSELREASKDKWTRTAAQTYWDTIKSESMERPAGDLPEDDYYHGTSKAWRDHLVDPHQGGSGADNLFGPGLYMTDSKDVALSYVKKGAARAQRQGVLDRTVYGLQWSGSRDPNFLDLEQAAPADARSVFSRWADNIEQRDYHDYDLSDMEKMRDALDDPQTTGAQLYQRFKALEHGQPSYEVDADLFELHDALREQGYDGFRYDGGTRTGNAAHNAYVVFNDFSTGKMPVDVSHVSSAVAPVTEAAATEKARQAVSEQLRTEPQDVLDSHIRSKYKSAHAPPGWDAIDDWSSAVVDAMKTGVHGRPVVEASAGELHDDLIQSVMNGRTPTIQELNEYDPIQRPIALKGRQVIPDGTGTVQRIANFGFRKILNPMVNILSRNQEFAVEYVQARRVLQGQVDAGLMTDDEAMVRAESQATTHVMRFVHNLHDRTQWTATMRNWAPFYFAQEQAYRRMGRLLAEDPGAFRRYQLAISGVGHINAQMQDSNGNSYLAFPGTGFIGKGVADMMGMHGVMVGGVSPAAFGGSLSSANVIFPLSQGVAPDLGPVAVIPAAQLQTHFLELGKRYPQFAKAANVAASALQYVDGQSSQSESIWEQLIPNTFVQRLVQAYNGDDRTFNSSVMEAYQYLDYQQAQATTKWEKDGSKGPAPSIVPAQTAPASEKQAFIDKVRNYVRALYVARALTGMVSPVSSSVEITNFGFPAKLNDEITKAGSVSTGMSNFLLKYPNAVPWTVAESFVPSNTDQSQPEGISLSSSQPAMNWIDANQALLNQYGPAALWLMPQLKNAQYSSTVYNEQIAQGLRVKDTPAQFLTALYVAAGDDLYYDGLSVHEAALTAAGNNSTAVNAEYANWDAWVQQVEKQYPVWAENFTSGVRQTNSQQAIRTLTDIFKASDAPKGEQSTLVDALLTQYRTAAAAYQQAGTQSNYSSAQSKVSDGWIAYLDSVSTSVPQLKPIIQSVFKEALKVQT